MKCPQCNNEIPEDSKFCLSCGSEIKFSDQEQFLSETNNKLREIDSGGKQSKTKLVVITSSIIILIVVMGLLYQHVQNVRALQTQEEHEQQLKEYELVQLMLQKHLLSADLLMRFL